VDLSGIIFVILALAWAVYLIPKALKHHDEVARTRSVDRFSTAMRVLARREPVDRSNARLVVTPPRSTQRVLVPSRPEPQAVDSPPPAVSPRRAAARRAAARAAARRRRRVIYVLLTAVVVVTGLAAFALLPWWSAAVPVALTVLYLALCRRQVRRASDAIWAPTAATDVAPRRAIRVDTAYGSAAAEPAHDEHSAHEDTVQIPVGDLQTVAVTAEAVDGSSLWDPLPVTLPTYVNKARAPRTVRTIDLGAADTWTSGRDEADTALVESTTADEPGEDAVQPEPWRAVGS
jgi:hypothetical protein